MEQHYHINKKLLYINYYIDCQFNNKKTVK